MTQLNANDGEGQTSVTSLASSGNLLESDSNNTIVDQSNIIIE